MNIHLISDESQLDQYLARWRELAKTPMQSPDWMLAWWNNYRTPLSKLNVLIVTDNDGSVRGLAPFCIHDRWGYGPTIAFLGSGRVSSDFQCLLATEGREVEVAECVGNWLDERTRDRPWGLCDFDGVAGDSPTIKTLVSHLRQRKCIAATYPVESTWRVDLTGGFDGFLQGMSKTQRRQSRNLLNRFDKSLAMRFEVSESADSMRKSIASLKTLHQQRWESSGRSGCFSDERFESFLVATSERFAERQQCKVFSLHAEDVPIASQLVLCNPDEYYVYQTGRDPNWESQSIGRLLNLLVIRQACQQSVRFLDYLRGNEIYKHRLGAAPSDCVRYRLIPPRWLPQVLHRATQFGRTIKHSFQQQRPSPQAVSSEEAI